MRNNTISKEENGRRAGKMHQNKKLTDVEVKHKGKKKRKNEDIEEEMRVGHVKRRKDDIIKTNV